MYYNVLELKDLPERGVNEIGNSTAHTLHGDNKVEKFNAETLLRNGDSNLSVVSLKKDEILDENLAACDGFLYVFEGEAEFHFEAEKFKIKKGEVIMFKKEREHKVLALKDTKFLLVNI